MSITEILLFMVSCILTNNFIFSRFLGCCPFLGVSSKVQTATGMGLAVTFVMGIASLVTYFVNLVLAALGVEYLQTIAFILVIAALVQIVEMFLKKSSPAIYKALGIYLPLITTNCAVLGIAQLNAIQEYTFIQSVVSGFSSAVGYTLAIVLLAGIRSRIREEDLPAPLRGAPIVLISAALMSIAFMGFSKLSF